MCFLNEFFRVRRVVVVASCCLCRELWLYARGWRVLLAERTLFLEGNQTNTHTQTHTKTRARALKSDDGSDAYVLFYFVCLLGACYLDVYASVRRTGACVVAVVRVVVDVV